MPSPHAEPRLKALPSMNVTNAVNCIIFTVAAAIVTALHVKTAKRLIKASGWLDRQLERQLPGHHFMITFTVPKSVRPFMRTHQKQAYTALFKASCQSIKKLAKDKKHIGGDFAGFTGILHTWGRGMQYHPHIHYIAPGDAFNKEDGRWYCFPGLIFIFR